MSYRGIVASGVGSLALRICRYTWALPASIVGIALATLALPRGRVRIVGGVLEAHGPWLARMLSTLVPIEGGAAAITFGHVVLARDERSLVLTRKHERVHVRQYERWGVVFFPAYLFASLYAMMSGRDYYFDNVFEREAARSEHNYNCGDASHFDDARTYAFEGACACTRTRRAGRAVRDY